MHQNARGLVKILMRVHQQDAVRQNDSVILKTVVVMLWVPTLFAAEQAHRQRKPRDPPQRQRCR